MEQCEVNPWKFSENNTENDFEYTLEWLVGSPPAFHTFNEVPLIKETVVSKIN